MQYVLDPRIFSTGSWKHLPRKDIELTQVDYEDFFARTMAWSYLPIAANWRIAKDPVMQDARFAVVTNDFLLFRTLRAQGREVSMVWDLPDIPNPRPSQTRWDTFARLSELYQKTRTQYIWLSAAFSLMVTGIILTAIGGGLLQLFVTSVPVWLTFLAIPVVGLLFFRWRQRSPINYGLFEIVAGIYTPIKIISGLDYDFAKLGVAELSAIAGGIYVIVRGLDNVGKGLEKRDSPYLKYWKKVF